MNDESLTQSLIQSLFSLLTNQSHSLKNHSIAGWVTPSSAVILPNVSYTYLATQWYNLPPSLMIL